jgi:hypothetical protein
MPNDWSVTRTYQRAGDIRREVANARVWGGLHYRNSTAAALQIGDSVSRWILRRFFQPSHAAHKHWEAVEKITR